MVVQSVITLSFVPASSAAVLAQRSQPAGTFERAMQDALEEASAAAAPDPAGLRLEDYEARIAEKIQVLPVHSSQALASHSVTITREGLEAMRKDPEYERWVLDTLAQNFAFDDPWSTLCGGSYHTHVYGATKEDYKGESWFPGYMGGQGEARFEAKSTGALWKRVAPSQKDTAAQYNASLYAKLRRERLLRKLALEHQQAQSELLEQSSIRRKLAEQNDGRTPLPSGTAPRITGVSAGLLLALLGGGM